MRICIKFVASTPILIPLHYNELIQGLIYHSLERSLATKLHDSGFIYQKRNFKLFTFSRILGRLQKKNGSFEINGSFQILISSPYEEMIESLAFHFLKKKEVKFGKASVEVEEIELFKTSQISTKLTIGMLSPLTVYSTFSDPEKGKKTYYYNPSEARFAELVKTNLIKKYLAFYGKLPPSEEFTIRPLGIRKEHEKILFYKGFVIKGWMGKFELEGEPELLRFAYEAGLGAKTSQGFGMFKILKREK